MGSDCSPYTLFHSVLKLFERSPIPLSFRVFATADVIEDLIKQHSNKNLNLNHIYLTPTASAISMDDAPLQAMKKRDASMIEGIKALKENKIHAFVSAGNTGALMAASKLQLSMIEPIKRPALLAIFPSETVVLDVGADLSSKVNFLVDYAMMGAIYQKIMFKKTCPRVGLLNVGTELSKGSFERRKIYEALNQKSQSGKFVFLGNVEGNDIFRGAVDVLVTDGFSGNVLLKTAEGAAEYIFEEISKTLTEEAILEQVSRCQQQLSYGNPSGAILMGVRGLVLKCHGKASVDSLYSGLLEAVKLLQRDFLHHFSQEMKIF